jgi:hypothetical protein
LTVQNRLLWLALYVENHLVGHGYFMSAKSVGTESPSFGGRTCQPRIRPAIHPMN